MEIEGNTAFGPEGIEEGEPWFLVYFSGQLLNPNNDCDNFIHVVGNLTVHYTEFDFNYKPDVSGTSNYIRVDGTLHYFGDSKINMWIASDSPTPPRTASFLVWRTTSINYAYAPTPPIAWEMADPDYWKTRWTLLGLEVYADYGPDA